MGFFDKVKALAIKAKCGVGFHAGDFVRAKGGPECKYEKNCPDCGEYVTKHEHAYGEPSYRNHHTCMMVKVCRHCAHENSFEKHEGYVDMGKDDVCKIKEKCIRCGHTQVKREDHTWYEVSRNETHKTLECLNCKRRETETLKRY